MIMAKKRSYIEMIEIIKILGALLAGVAIHYGNILGNKSFG